MKKLIELVKSKLKQWNNSPVNARFKKNILNAIPFWIGAILTGAVAIFYAKLFGWAEDGSAYLFHKVGWLTFIVTPLCFMTAFWLVVKYATYARGSGIPQVSAAIELSDSNKKNKVSRLLGFRIIIVKIFSSLIMVFGGGAIGREGPTIQISASIFKIINDFLPPWYPSVSRRNMIVTGAAAGLASAFNTPLGGIVFAIEELTKTHFSYFKSALLTGVIIAGLTALNFLGPYLYLGYPELDDISAWIVLVIIPVAIISGLCGSGMGAAILYLFKTKRRLLKKKYQRLSYAFVCGLIVAILAVFVDHGIYGSGKEIMVTTLFTDEKYVEWYIPLLRIFGPIISFSVGASGGIFAPALSAGASIGSYVSELFQLSDTSTNLIILCGMTGLLTGITGSPFTSSILVLEMTTSHTIIFYIMITALAANLVSSAITKQSFYEYIKEQYILEIKESPDVQTKPSDKKINT